MKNIVNLTDKTLPQAASHPVKARTPLGENQLAITATQIAIALSALGIWQYSVEAGWIDRFFLAPPTEVFAFLVQYARSGELWRHGSVTIQDTIMGFLSGSILGVLCGLAIGWSRFLDRVFTPFLTIFNSLPRVALAPMFILWFGIEMTSKVLLSFSLVFFIVVVNTEAGVRSVESDLNMMARVTGANEFQRFMKVVLPGAVPAIFAGLKIGVVYALLGVVVGEMVASRAGLGQQVVEYSNTYRPAGVFGTLAVLAVIALVLNFLMLSAERWLMRWKEV